MKILFLTHSFNSLTQRLFVELRRDGHEISVEFDINDAVAEQAVGLFQPELIIAPFLKRKIPDSIWQNHRCLIVHPGIVGDRGPSSVDWAIMRGDQRWGVTCLQADAEMDAGDIWATAEFDMRDASKSSLYRNEVTEAALESVRQAISRIESGGEATPLDYEEATVQGQWHCLMQQSDRTIEWALHSTDEVLRRIRAADSVPGVVSDIGGRDYALFNGYQEHNLNLDRSAEPGSLIGHRDGAVCLATIDGALWVTHLRLATPAEGEHGFKLPATLQLAEALANAPESLKVPELALLPEAETDEDSWQEICYRESGHVGYLHFDFYNGAMGTEQCQRLQQAVIAAKQRDIRVLVLLGGSEFWSNGIHLNLIEAAESPADESWRNINAMNDLCRELIESPNQMILAAMQANAGAGGVFMALAADRVIARESVILNPHYRSMGNLYGSEYWTYLLPQRVGDQQAKQLMQNRLPVTATEAQEIGLIDQVISEDRETFVAQVMHQARMLAEGPDFSDLLAMRNKHRADDFSQKPLQAYRDEELKKMKLNFYGFDPSYHVARYHFVEKLPKARTPSWLACHRKL
ncbi:hydrogenase maturation protein [Amphritea balenae]|uniref:Hydrogenase maturation protein n=1 Tax=Amphritea balenae TaxID=452629 RepID=A0A3P1SWG0_9GAMM|nr:hydrogenase maturation protein [Amphritea balenae]RRD01368.1 hydrogenase maturation protein [Amphritea balenae]GGK57676.1 hydrogenase maturation protein [Amphritea balenae]